MTGLAVRAGIGACTLFCFWLAVEVSRAPTGNFVSPGFVVLSLFLPVGAYNLVVFTTMFFVRPTGRTGRIFALGSVLSVILLFCVKAWLRY